MRHGRGFGIVADQNGIQHLLADAFRRLLAERVFSRLAQRLAPFFLDVPEGDLAGPVPDKSFVVLKLDIEAVDLHRGQPQAP
ncbi:hypothetical protein ABIF63_001332 [Bradyrhizobium japonicum]|uniref:Uncharacterized protein n=1 Tax=Bradyrhizobium japonicum TaxID=375 RepID=A0ABV2RJX0_BRAJP